MRLPKQTNKKKKEKRHVSEGGHFKPVLFKGQPYFGKDRWYVCGSSQESLQRLADLPSTLSNCRSTAESRGLLLGRAGTSLAATREHPTPVPTEYFVLENTDLVPKNKLPFLRPQTRALVIPCAAVHTERPPGFWLCSPGACVYGEPGRASTRARWRSRRAYQSLSGS